MDMNSVNIEEIVKQVLAGMNGQAGAKTGSGDTQIPKTAHVAMLTSLENFEIKEFPMPEVGDDDILVAFVGQTLMNIREILLA